MTYPPALAALVIVATLAGILARRAPHLQPLARALGALVVLACVRALLAPHLLAPGPYTGRLAWLLRLDVVLACCWPAPLIVLVANLGETGSKSQCESNDSAWLSLGERWWWRRRKMALAPLAIGLALAAAYPHLRGPWLIRAQEMPRLVAVVVAVEALGSASRRGLGPWLTARRERLPVAVLALEQAVQLVGAWAPGDVAARWGAVAGPVTLAGDALLVLAMVWAAR